MPIDQSSTEYECGRLYHPDWPEGPRCDVDLSVQDQASLSPTHRNGNLTWSKSPDCSVEVARAFVGSLKSFRPDFAKKTVLNDDQTVTLPFDLYFGLADNPTRVGSNR